MDEDAFGRPVVVTLVDGIPRTECRRQVTPWTANPQPIQNANWSRSPSSIAIRWSRSACHPAENERQSSAVGAWSTGNRTDALTVGTDRTSHLVQAVAFAENSRAELRLEGGDGQTISALKTGGGKPGQSYPAVMVSKPLKNNIDAGIIRRTATEFDDANAIEANAIEILSVLRREIGEEAFAEWGLGVLTSFQAAAVLLSDLLRRLSSEGKIGRELEFSAHNGAEQEAAGAGSAIDVLLHGEIDAPDHDERQRGSEGESSAVIGGAGTLGLHWRRF